LKLFLPQVISANVFKPMSELGEEMGSEYSVGVFDPSIFGLINLELDQIQSKMSTFQRLHAHYNF